MTLATCPSLAELEGLSRGGLPEREVEVLEQHVLECGSCLEKLKKRFPSGGTLAGVPSDDTACDASSSPVVAELMKQLESLRSTSAVSPRGVPMNDPTACLPPSPGPNPSRPDERTQVSQGDAGKSPANTSLSNPDGAGEVANRPGPDACLTDFLAPPQAEDELGRLGKYRILKVLGQGGMGVVFQAEDPGLKRSVAFKAMLPALAASASSGKRFLREAQAMAAVEHDHIVRIYQVDEEGGVPFLAMEFLKGEPLDERLKRPEQMSPGEVVRIGREIAEGLAAAHERDLIHRDIKPANIWLEGQRQRVKILDFGLARAVSEDAGLTQAGSDHRHPGVHGARAGRGEPH